MDPTKREVFEKLAGRRQVFRRLHQEQEYDEEILEASARFRDTKIMSYLRGFPPRFIAKVPSLARDVIETGVTQIKPGETPSVDVILPPGVHRDEKAAAKHKDDLEQKYRALLWYVETYSSESPFHGMIQHALGLGLGVITYPLMKSRWPDSPFKLKNGKNREPRNAKERAELERWKRTRMRMPFDLRVVHPRTFFFDPYHDPIEDCIEEQNVALAAYANEYPHLNLPRTGTQKSAKLVTYFSPDWYGVWLNQMPCLTAEDGANEDGLAPNTTGILPYKMARGGFGDRTYNGEWEYAIKGILRDGRDMILGHITSYNVMEVMRSWAAFVPLDVSGPPGKEGQAPSDWGPGMVWYHDSDVQLNEFKLPQLPPVVYQMLERQDEELGIHFGPYKDALRGTQTGGKETASGLRTRVSIGRGYYATAKQSTQQAASAFLMDVSYYIKHILQEPFSFPSREAIITISPDEIEDGTRLIVDWSPPSPEDKAFELQDLLQRKQQGTISVRHILEEDDSIEDPDEEEANILADMIMQQPQVIGVLAQDAITKFGGGMNGAMPSTNGASPMNGAMPQSPMPGVQAGGGMTPPGQQSSPPVLGGAQDTMNQNRAYTLPQTR